MNKRHVPDRNKFIVSPVSDNPTTLRRRIDDLDVEVRDFRTPELDLSQLEDLIARARAVSEEKVQILTGWPPPAAVSPGAMYKSTDFGASWMSVQTPSAFDLPTDINPTYSKEIWSVAVSSSNIVTITGRIPVGGSTGFSRTDTFTSYDGGQNWLVTNGNKPVYQNEVRWIEALQKFVSPADRFLRWSDDGLTWYSSGQLNSSPHIRGFPLIVHGNDIYVPFSANFGGQSFDVSSDGGYSWTNIDSSSFTGMSTATVGWSVAYWNGEFFAFAGTTGSASTNRTRFFRSTDMINWTEMTINSLTGNQYTFAIGASSYITTSSGIIVLGATGWLFFGGADNNWTFTPGSFGYESPTFNSDGTRILHISMDGNITPSPSKAIYEMGIFGSSRVLTSFPWHLSNPFTAAQNPVDGTIWVASQEYRTPLV
jgi:hypothetical protein